MLAKVLFWLLTAGNVAAVGLFFLLGLAAAPSSRTPALAVAAFMLVVPGLLIAASIAMFMLARSPGWRAGALLLAAAPLIAVACASWYGGFDLSRYQDPAAEGGYAHFRAGPMRELEAAITRNDAAVVAALAGKADLKTQGRDGSGVLIFALRQLHQQPGPPDVLRALLQAGADPNMALYDMPLTLAILGSAKTGPEPVQLLLAAGANPNLRASHSDPAYFAATAKTVDLAVLRLLLDTGADLRARSGDKGNVLSRAAAAQNWKAVLLLLERGAPWQGVRTPMGLDFRGQVESELRHHGSSPDIQAVLGFLDRAEGR